jgi:hypothetical protein
MLELISQERYRTAKAMPVDIGPYHNLVDSETTALLYYLLYPLH